MLSDRDWLPILLGLLGLAGLYAVGQYNFLLFHGLSEAYSIIIAIAVFVIFWNTRQLLQNSLYLVVGFGCLFGGIFDLIYIFAYPGMSMFPDADGNLALQAKTVAQWYVSLSCVGAFLYLRRGANPTRALLVYSAIAAIALEAIFSGIFPDCFQEGVGITAFERIGLAISCSAYLASLVLLIRNRGEFESRVYKIMLATLIAFFVQDAVSAVAVDMDGFARIVAHLCQVAAIYFVYKAFVEVGLRKPYDLLFRNLQQSAEEIRQINTTLQQRTTQLRALAGELTLSEQRERRRLAKILHDHLQQILVGSKFRLTVLGRGADEITKQGVKEVEELIDESIRISRSLTAELSPPILHEAGLRAGLEWLGKRMADTHALFVELNLDDIGNLPESTSVVLYEAARELLFNAVKHAKVRSACLSLRQVDGALQLSISDEGIGFDPEALPRVGESGTGYGLFGIRERLYLLGGNLEIRSTPGQGSRFVITVPIEHAPAEELSRKSIFEKVYVEKSMPPVSDKKIRLVIADDHAVVRQGLSRVLASEGDIDVIGLAANGREAVEISTKLIPDVILMDFSMPVLNGVEATRMIKNEFPDICIIGLSMFEEAERAQAMRDAGASDYLTKSGPIEALVNAIRKERQRFTK